MKPTESLKPWHQVIVPHEDIRRGRFDEAVFAADLSDVLADRGPLEYRDPATFFRRTYPTRGLVNLLSAMVARLAGAGWGEAVIQIQTPFGGGKTHSLIALYHLFRHGGELITSEAVGEILREAGVEAVPPARVIPQPAADPAMRSDAEIEAIGMQVAMEYERGQGRRPTDVSQENLGYDIRSQDSGGATRYIEVKARATTGPIVFTPNEWFMAQRLGEEYWLYIVEDAGSQPVLYTLQNPAANLEPERVTEIVRFVVKNWKEKVSDARA